MDKTNEAAERLRLYTQSMTPEMFALLDKALAAERRATVERIADLFEGPNGPPLMENEQGQTVVDWDSVEHAILDEEAAR